MYNEQTFPIDDPGNRVFCIFEGQCPECGGELGEDQSNENDWHQFKCQDCNHQSYVEEVAGGDWASN